MILVKHPDKHFSGKITVMFCTSFMLEMCWLLPSVCSTNHALAVLIFKEEEMCHLFGSISI